MPVDYNDQEAGPAASEERGVRRRPEAGVGGPGGWVHTGWTQVGRRVNFEW